VGRAILFPTCRIQRRFSHENRLDRNDSVRQKGELTIKSSKYYIVTVHMYINEMYINVLLIKCICARLRCTVHRCGLCGGRDPDFSDIFPKNRSASDDMCTIDLFWKCDELSFATHNRFEQAGKIHDVQLYNFVREILGFNSSHFQDEHNIRQHTVHSYYKSIVCRAFSAGLVKRSPGKTMIHVAFCTCTSLRRASK